MRVPKINPKDVKSCIRHIEKQALIGGRSLVNSFSIPSRHKHLQKEKKKKKSANIYAPTNNQRPFLLSNLIIPLPLPTPAAPTARVVTGPMVTTRSVRAMPTMWFLVHLILELASRDRTTYHSQYAMVSHLVSCEATSQTTGDGSA